MTALTGRPKDAPDRVVGRDLDGFVDHVPIREFMSSHLDVLLKGSVIKTIWGGNATLRRRLFPF